MDDILYVTTHEPRMKVLW